MDYISNSTYMDILGKRLSKSLLFAGISTIHCGNGQHALAKLHGKFWCSLLDEYMQMPEITGHLLYVSQLALSPTVGNLCVSIKSIESHMSMDILLPESESCN